MFIVGNYACIEELPRKGFEQITGDTSPDVNKADDPNTSDTWPDGEPHECGKCIVEWQVQPVVDPELGTIQCAVNTQTGDECCEARGDTGCTGSRSYAYERCSQDIDGVCWDDDAFNRSGWAGVAYCVEKEHDCNDSVPLAPPDTNP